MTDKIPLAKRQCKAYLERVKIRIVNFSVSWMEGPMNLSREYGEKGQGNTETSAREGAGSANFSACRGLTAKPSSSQRDAEITAGSGARQSLINSCFPGSTPGPAKI